jgi:hypothetical protein
VNGAAACEGDGSLCAFLSARPATSPAPVGTVGCTEKERLYLGSAAPGPGRARRAAPHQQRCFILAHAAREGLEGRCGHPAQSPPGLPVERRGGWLPEPGLGRVADGLPARLDRRARLTALGNAVVPDVASAIAEAIQAAAERTRSANVLRNLATFGATTARQ